CPSHKRCRQSRQQCSGFVGTGATDVRRVLESIPGRIQLEDEDIIRPEVGARTAKVRLKCIFKWEIDRGRPTGNVGRSVGIDGNTKWVVVANPTDICGINETTRRADFCSVRAESSASSSSSLCFNRWMSTENSSVVNLTLRGEFMQCFVFGGSLHYCHLPNGSGVEPPCFIEGTRGKKYRVP